MRLCPILFALVAAAPLGVAAQDLVLPTESPMVLAVDPCEILQTCVPAAQLGLPQGTPDLLVPEWGLSAIAAMSGTRSPQEAQSYARGLSDKSLVDWCEVCSCCAIRSEGLDIGPDTGARGDYFRGMVGIRGE
jgi:hypothetical protein